MANSFGINKVPQGGLMSSPLMRAGEAAFTGGASLLAQGNSPLGKAFSLYNLGSNIYNGASKLFGGGGSGNAAGDESTNKDFAGSGALGTYDLNSGTMGPAPSVNPSWNTLGSNDDQGSYNLSAMNNRMYKTKFGGGNS